MAFLYLHRVDIVKVIREGGGNSDAATGYQYCGKLTVPSSSVESGSQIRRQINLVSKENADFGKFLIFSSTLVAA